MDRGVGNSSTLGGTIYWTVRGEKIARLGDIRRLFTVSLFQPIGVSHSYRECAAFGKICRGLMFVAEVLDNRRKERETIMFFSPPFIWCSIIAVPFWAPRTKSNIERRVTLTCRRLSPYTFRLSPRLVTSRYSHCEPNRKTARAESSFISSIKAVRSFGRSLVSFLRSLIRPVRKIFLPSVVQCSKERFEERYLVIIDSFNKFR